MNVGAYSEKMIIGADKLIRLADHTLDEVAAAATLQGLPAYYLLHESWKVETGDPVLV